MQRSFVFLFSLLAITTLSCSDEQPTISIEAPPKTPIVAESQEPAMLGLNLTEVAGWRPVWDADAKAARWEHDAYMSAIVVRRVSEKLGDIEELKRAAPWLRQLGSAITRVIEVQQADLGWYAVVQREKERDFVYVQKHGSQTVLCTARLTKSQIRTISKEIALKVCDSIRAK